LNRFQLEHVIRAASTIAGDTEIVVIGSQAIPGRYPEAPAELLVSGWRAAQQDRRTDHGRLRLSGLGEGRAAR
jgi:hypothetical protein